MKELLQRLTARRHSTQYRRLRARGHSEAGRVAVDGKQYWQFASNDYLAVNDHPQLRQLAAQAVLQWGSGSGGSPLVTGHSTAHQALQERLQQWLGSEHVLLMSSGFAANQACLALLPETDEKIFADRLVHASLISGMQQSGKRFRRFRHNDTSQLQQWLHREPSNIGKWIVSEGVFSMDGDQAPVAELIRLARQYQARLLLDDAHGIGALGEAGRGIVAPHKMPNDAVYTATFGKALGCHGAFIGADAETIDAIQQFAPEYIYSTAMPASQAAFLLEVISWLVTAEGIEARQRLQQNIHRMRQLFEHFGIATVASESAIQVAIMGSSENANRCAEVMREQGVWAVAIRPPTVAEGSARVRFCVSAAHGNEAFAALERGFKVLRDEGIQH
ncbi:aminotransferase class I/II-fold pyridoxal phosphate-dependent enzyme [Idiomarina tyrosinivorans]|uniref:aminotransferase class I/II-fold pyridoxal phosphate-dependent enzyme n=1 Tax=Idiomarina tyrosinivorans TaxID=1445662 RepID=UPI0013003AA7|nr:8-amino-7-oxononanoate synthase [Idiomarina tyrosinivorans]